MIEIVLASRNKKKFAEMQTHLDAGLCGKVKILSLDDIGFDGDIEEYGDSFETNSLIKASVPAKLGYIGIADDSGLCVDALGGEPGIYSARYSADEGEFEDTDAANRRKLLRRLDGKSDDERAGGFVCVASLVLPEDMNAMIPEKYLADEKNVAEAGVACGKAATVRGECRGTIMREEKGSGGFGYDSLFYSTELGKSFAEASGEEKNKVSHRGRAMREFVRVIADVVGE